MHFSKLIAFVLSVFCLCTTIPVPAYASSVDFYIDDGIALSYEIADVLTSKLSIDGSTATLRSDAKSADAVSIAVEHVLEKRFLLLFWSEVDGTTQSKYVNGNNIVLLNTQSCLGNGTYRVKSTFTLTDSTGKSETITIRSSEKVVG